MNFPVQVGWQQVVLILLAILGVVLLISAVMSLIIKVKEIELLEDEEGNRYKRWRRHRRPRMKRGASGIVLLLLAIFLLWASFMVQAYLGFSGKIKVGHVYATEIANHPHELIVDLTLYDPDGNTISRKSYGVEGDTWVIEAHVLRFKPWVNFLGIHSGYKITRLYGKYDSGQASKQNDIWLNGPDNFYQEVKDKKFWTNPLVDAAYGNAVILPSGEYDLYIENNAITAAPTNR